MKQWSIIVLILLWLGWHLARPVDLFQSDLGRHIKNGELILQGNWDILYKNYYSYTYPEYPFINHHWLFGVFCYVCWHFFGFSGLAFIYLIIELITFLLFFRCWQRYSTFPIACAFGLLSIPLICFRPEIRPEGISYLFCGLFCWMIDSFQQNRLRASSLIIGLCLIQVLWVNTHIFFLMGPIITCLFWWQAFSHKQGEQTKVFQTLIFFLIGMCLVNPSGINGLLVPFTIDRAYFLFPTSENQSILSFFKFKSPIYDSAYEYFLVSFLMLNVVIFFLAKREGWKKYILIIIINFILAAAAMKSVRLIGFYPFFWITSSAFVFSQWMQYAETPKTRKNFEIGLVLLGILLSSSVNFDWNQKPFFGILPGNNNAAEFFKREKLSGVIFNNANIGNYLIFQLSPQQKVFLDMRIQPYPSDFLMNTYEQMNDETWHQLERKYNFNVIFISFERSPGAIKFLVHRLMDPSWAPVYYSKDAIIFLKRNNQNAPIIKRDELRPDKIMINF